MLWGEGEPSTRRQGHIDAADANHPRARDGLEIGQDLDEAITAERTIEEENGPDSNETNELGGVAMNDRNAGDTQAPREVATRNDERGLNLQADRTCSRKKVNQRRGSSEARTDIYEHVRRMDGGLLHDPEQGVDWTWQVWGAAPWKVRAVVGNVAETKHQVDPGVAVLRRHADERRSK
jgi:hypothetical protein